METVSFHWIHLNSRQNYRHKVVWAILEYIKAGVDAKKKIKYTVLVENIVIF